VTGLFLSLYASSKIAVDLFREYPTTLLGLAAGQALNLAMSVLGLALLVWSLRRRAAPILGGERRSSRGLRGARDRWRPAPGRRGASGHQRPCSWHLITTDAVP
jgi:hypothetical protein